MSSHGNRPVSRVEILGRDDLSLEFRWQASDWKRIKIVERRPQRKDGEGE